MPLQRTHGFGVSPAAWSASQRSTTPARNSARRSIDRCGMPQLVRKLARAADRLRRAAAEIAVVLRVRPQLERHADGLAPRVRERAARRRRCRRRRSSPRACGPACGASVARSRAAAPSARCSASAASSAAWRFAALSPPSSAAISAAPMRAASSSAAPRTRLDGGAAGRDHRAAAARVEARVDDAARPGRRDRARARPDQIAAGGSAGGAGERVRVVCGLARPGCSM